MPATSQYDVLLDGSGYLIDPETYRGRLKNPFAPKTRTGDTGYGDLAGGSAWAQSDFRGGFGYEEWDPEHPDRFADGTAIDISYGDLRPGRTLSLVASSPHLIAPLVIHRGVLYGIASGGSAIYSSTDGTSWTLATSPSPAVGSLWVHAQQLWAGSGTTGDFWALSAAGTWAAGTPLPYATGIPSGFQSRYAEPALSLFAAIGVSGGGPPTTPFIAPGVTSLWNVAAGTPGPGPGPGSITYRASVPYDTIGALATDGTQAYVAARTTGTGGVVTGALYHVADISVPATYTTISDFNLLCRIHDNAIASFQVYKGQLYAGSYTKGIVWKVTATGLEVVFQVPELAMSGAPPAYTYPIPQMTTDNERLYIPITDREGACVYQFDGTGWCRFTTALGGGVLAGAIIAFGDAIVLATSAGVYRAAPGYASPATYITSWFDAALGGIDKIPLSFTLTHTPLAAGQSVTVDYALNDATAWITLGTSDVDGATELELEFAEDIGVTDRIRFRYTFVGSTSATPIKLRTVVFHYQVAPDVKREWLFTALCAGVPGKELIRIDETAEPRTGAQISDALWASRAKKEVLDYTDIDGAAYRVTFESLEEEIDRGRPRAELATRAAVRLTEA